MGESRRGKERWGETAFGLRIRDVVSDKSRVRRMVGLAKSKMEKVSILPEK